jgi:SAM-dependent methyltransferase
LPNAVTADANEQANLVFTSPLFRRLWAEAWADEYPVEIEALSTTSWTTIGRVVGALRLRPGQVLVDLGCGRGGPGLWLARAFQAKLIGIDHSSALVDLAAQWADQWVRPGMAEFRVGSLSDSGLPGESVDGLFSNATALASDVPEALAEISRILRPGGRAAFSINESLDEGTDERWRDLVGAAGMEFDARHEMPDAVAGFRRLTELIERCRDDLVSEVGEAAAAYIFRDTETYGARLDEICWALIIAHKP